MGVYASLSDIYLEGDATYEKNTILEDHKDIPSDATIALEHRVWLPMIIKQPDYQSQFDIGFQLYYRGRTADTLKVLLAQLAAEKPYVWGTPGFYLILLGLYIIVLIMLWYLVWKATFE